MSSLRSRRRIREGFASDQSRARCVARSHFSCSSFRSACSEVTPRGVSSFKIWVEQAASKRSVARVVLVTCCTAWSCASCVEASRQYGPPTSSRDDAEPQGKRLLRDADAHRFCCRRCLYHGICKLITQQGIAAASSVLNGRKLVLLKCWTGAVGNVSARLALSVAPSHANAHLRRPLKLGTSEQRERSPAAGWRGVDFPRRDPP